MNLVLYLADGFVTEFCSLQLARVVFRFLFTVPLLVIALDGIIDGPHTVNKTV